MEVRNEDLKSISDLAADLTKSSQSSRKSAATIETTIQRLATILSLDVNKELPKTTVEVDTETEGEDKIDTIANENKQLLMDIQRIESMTLRSKQLLQEKQRIFMSLADWATVKYAKDNQSIEGLKNKTENYLQQLQTSKENLWLDSKVADQSIERLTEILLGLQNIVNDQGESTKKA